MERARERLRNVTLLIASAEEARCNGLGSTKAAVRGTRSELAFSTSRNYHLDGWAHDGAKLPAARGTCSDKDTPCLDRSASGKRERDSPHSSWWESSWTRPRHLATSETRASAMVTPPSTENILTTKRRRGLRYFPQGAEASSSVRFSATTASNIQQQHPSSVASPIVSESPTRLPSLDPLTSTTRAVLLRAIKAEKPAAGSGGGNGPSSAEPRIVPKNELPSAEASLRPTTPSSSSTVVSRQTSLGTISQTIAGVSFRYSEEHEHREEEFSRGTVVVRCHKSVNHASVGRATPADGGIDKPLQSEHGTVQDHSTNQIAETGLTTIDRPSSGMQENVTRGLNGCREIGCHRRPIYAFMGSIKALYCSLHRSEEMVNVRHPLCRHESCFRQPSFGMEGQKRARYCSEHKDPGMINVSSRRCRAVGCLRHPNFGFESDRRASYCCRHKAAGMIDIVSRRCKHHQCVRRPLYAMPGQRAVLCRIHKEPGMVDVVSRRCDYEEGCDRHPSFGWKQEEGGKARRCGHHRLDGMESVKVRNRGKRQAASLVVTDRC